MARHASASAGASTTLGPDSLTAETAPTDGGGTNASTLAGVRLENEMRNHLPCICQKKRKKKNEKKKKERKKNVLPAGKRLDCIGQPWIAACGVVLSNVLSDVLRDVSRDVLSDVCNDVSGDVFNDVSSDVSSDA